MSDGSTGARCAELDRITATRRPAMNNAGTQKWRELLFVHWSVPIEVVRPLIPAAIDLDPYDGKMWIGMVPFRMQGIRTWFMPPGTGLEFLELNLRTYVHYKGRPGVWFFSLEASSWLAVQGARNMWNLPYWHARMRTSRDGMRIAFESMRNAADASFSVEYTVGEELGPSAPGTFEFFLFERYLLFAQKGRVTLEGQVHHPPYHVHEASVQRLDESLMAAAGLPGEARAPELAHWSPGVDVEVFGPWDASKAR